MAEQIKMLGYRDLLVLNAIVKVPRHLFVDATLEEMAYLDKALPIGANQTISAPSMVALQSTLLNVAPGQKVLEIGTGSGYQAAILAEMGVNLFSIERQKSLHLKTANLLKSLDYKANLVFGDGFEGLPEQAPFDRIIITAGASEIPMNLVKQLAIGGLMVAPIVIDGRMKVVRICRETLTNNKIEYFNDCSFVPMLSGVVDK